MTSETVAGGEVLPTDEIVVELDGVAYHRWETVRISRELNAASGTFELSATLTHPFPAKAGAEARIFLGNQLAATGFVDSLRLELSSTAHTVTISGRDRTAELVDCSVPPDLGQLSNVYLDDIVHELADPYDVEVEFAIDASPIFPVFAANQGDTAWAAIEKATRARSKLCFPTADGKLRIATPGDRNAVGPVVEGYADLELHWSTLERFQTYVVRGQNRGSNAGWGSAVAAIEGIAGDTSILRPRVLVVIAEGPLDSATARERADWERTVRVARSAAITATVRGWRQTPAGRLWTLNELVAVTVHRWGFSDRLLLDGLEFTRGDDGTKTALRLIRPSSYLPEPGKKDPFDSWAAAPASDTEPDTTEEER